jgi:aryl-alcohol dehydrogenase-like predicted oxidoreductase
VLTAKYKVDQKAEAGSRAARQDKRMLEAEWRTESLLIAEKLEVHARAKGVSLAHWATAWVLANAAITSVIAGPRTLEQWTSYLGALDYAWTAEDEKLADTLVVPGHPSTPGFNDPAYPIEGRFPTVT